MKIKLLPSNTGVDSQLQLLTTFLIDDRVAVDGGSVGFALTPDEMSLVRDVVVTHSHADHTASLPIFVAEAYARLESPIRIHGLPEVITSLRDFVFNHQVWPDFEKISLMNDAGPAIQFNSMEPRAQVRIAGLAVTPIPVNHTVPNVGLVVSDDRSTVVFTSDTYITDEIWEASSRASRLRAIFVDVSYPNELEGLAAASKHLTPQSLASDLKKLGGREVEIYAVHIKPTNRDQVIAQLAGLTAPSVRVAEIGKTYAW